MSWSCPFHAFQLPLHVPDIFSVCPLHFPCMSRSFVASHFPTSPVVPIGFLCFVSLSFPLHSPCFHCCPLHVPFSSPLFPFHVPLLSCHVDFLFPPLISLHFLAFSLCSPIFPAKKHGFPAFSQLGRPTTQSFSRFSAKGGRNPKPAKSRQGGIEPGTPVSLGGGGSDVGRGVRGGFILYPLRCPTRRAMSADILATHVFCLLSRIREDTCIEKRARMLYTWNKIRIAAALSVWFLLSGFLFSP